MRVLFTFFLCFALLQMNGQHTISGIVLSHGKGLSNVQVQISEVQTTVTDTGGYYKFENLLSGKYEVAVNADGYRKLSKNVTLGEGDVSVDFEMADYEELDEVVISGTMKAVSRSDSPVPVEIYRPAFFKKNPTANIFEALQTVNGVRPQLNCNICNTGDIHINGLEGPYTMVMIDGMPIVSGLSTVYGLSGIPNSLVERIEIVKGPASSLYGSEAVGGLINIITKSPASAPRFMTDVFSTSWGEVNIDLGVASKVGSSAEMLTGINYFNYSNPQDHNGDNFTDVTLQDRISIFQKWNFIRKSGKLFSLAGRFFYEDRWGGEIQWNKSYRGGDEVYGESIYTKRWELLGAYQFEALPSAHLSFSVTDHDQNSVYGDIPFMAKQQIGFSQFVVDRKLAKHDLLFGAAVRYQMYDDNSPATLRASHSWIPGLFVQDEIKLAEGHNLLAGLRYDYNDSHGSIFTPRLAYKWKATEKDIIRLNAGTGFRVVNLFTEEHAALTGSRDVVVLENLRPERSYNTNLNYLKKIYGENGTFVGIETSAWYTYFTNAIIGDYDTDPNKIIYKNLDGYSVTQGISCNIDMILPNGIKAIVGATLMDVYKYENQRKTPQMLTERFSATWALSYKWKLASIDIDYTGNLYGPMRLPLLGPLDPRREYSPVWSIQNIQFTFTRFKDFEIYTGVKNLLDWTPNRGNPFIIARSEDPFDKYVQFDNSGMVIPTTDNPYALTFDPAYVYGANQGIRTFMGIRYKFK